MTEEEARSSILRRYGSEAILKLEDLADLVAKENVSQNLVAPSTLTQMWNRHLLDSAQLVDLAQPQPDAIPWIDIGSGAGFPGLVVALLTSRRMILVEPRKRRAAFLVHAIDVLKLASRVAIMCDRVEKVNVRAATITARAVAPLGTLFQWGTGCADLNTEWLLPKGRSALREVASAKEAWQGTFHVEHSITDPTSMIVIASGVERR